MDSVFIFIIVAGYIVFRIIRSSKTADSLRDINHGIQDLNAKITFLERKIERLAEGRVAAEARESVPEADETIVQEPEKSIEILCEEMPQSGQEEPDIDIAALPEVPVVEPPKPSADVHEGDRMERFIGVNLFSKIGIAVLVIGIGFFVKYAIDNNWIGEVARTIFGLVAGAALWAVSYFLKDRYRSFSSVLGGGGFAVCFVTIAVAYNFYGIFSPLAAFLILIALVMAEIAMALWYDRRELAAVGIVAAFAAPFLSAGPDGSTVALTGYVAILSAAIFCVSFRRASWYELPLIGCVLSWIIVVLAALWVKEGESYALILALNTLIFIIYSLPLPAIPGQSPDGRKHIGAVVGAMFVNNFLYIVTGLMLVKHVPYVFDGIVPMVAAAADGFVFCRYYLRKNRSLPQDILVLLIAVTSCLVFPVQFRSHCVAVTAIAFYAFALNYLYCRLDRRIFKYLALACVAILAVDLLLVRDLGSPKSAFFSYFFSGAALVGSAATLSFYPMAYRSDRNLVYTAALWFGIASGVYGSYLLFDSVMEPVAAYRGAVAIYLAAVLVLALLTDNGGNAAWLLPVLSGLSVSLTCMPCASAGAAGTVLFWVCVALCVSALVIQSRKCYRGSLFAPLGRNVFTVLLIASAVAVAISATFNILMLCNLQKLNSASISVLLSVAGAIAVAMGLRRHDKLLRMTGLCTFGIVLVKLVVYDLWNMPSIGRIIVFIILGVLLLGISFLYNKLRRALFDD